MTHLECTRCGKSHAFSSPINLCECGGILYPRYDLAGLRGTYDRAETKSGPDTLWRYRRVLPVRDAANIVSLGEGFTPMFQAVRQGPLSHTQTSSLKTRAPTPPSHSRPAAWR